MNDDRPERRCDISDIRMRTESAGGQEFDRIEHQGREVKWNTFIRD